MTHTDTQLPIWLPFLRLRLTLRLLEDAPLPAAKGALLRGGFGYAFQRTCCPQSCWERSEQCAMASLCAFRWVFATPRPPDVAEFHDLQDIPRPFVIEPPVDGRTNYHAGETLEFGLTLIGRGIEHLPYFLFGFEELGRMGLGRRWAKARLERVVALPAWAPDGQVIYQDGHAVVGPQLPLLDAHTLQQHAGTLPSTLRITMHTPLRLKANNAFLQRFNFPAIVRAIGWRLTVLARFYGQQPWNYDYRPWIEQAQQVTITEERTYWDDLLRTSTRGGLPRTMPHGGIVGNVLLRDVPVPLREALVVGSIIHVGKSCTFGHGGYWLGPV